MNFIFVLIYMKLYHIKKLILFIPSTVIKYSNEMVIFKLIRPISIEQKLKLYNIDNFSDIKLKLKYRNYLENNSLTVINDNIYKFHLINDDISNNIYANKTYYLTNHKFLNINADTKQLTSNWFLNNL